MPVYTCRRFSGDYRARQASEARALAAAMVLGF